jgi:hypothetical protein
MKKGKIKASGNSKEETRRFMDMWKVRRIQRVNKNMKQGWGALSNKEG